MSADTPQVDSEELRALVRQVLREALPSSRAGMDVDVPVDGTSNVNTGQLVRVESDDDLAELVRAVAVACADPVRRAELAADGGGYRLERAESPLPAETATAETATAEPAEAEQPPVRVERGAVTERHVRQAERAGGRVVAAPGVVVTPLARDRARSGGVRIDRDVPNEKEQ